VVGDQAVRSIVPWNPDVKLFVDTQTIHHIPTSKKIVEGSAFAYESRRYDKKCKEVQRKREEKYHLTGNVFFCKKAVLDCSFEHNILGCHAKNAFTALIAYE
jgi:hypothetical protein